MFDISVSSIEDVDELALRKLSADLRRLLILEKPILVLLVLLLLLDVVRVAGRWFC